MLKKLSHNIFPSHVKIAYNITSVAKLTSKFKSFFFKFQLIPVEEVSCTRDIEGSAMIDDIQARIFLLHFSILTYRCSLLLFILGTGSDKVVQRLFINLE